jgi:hypothetical protein
MLPGDLGSNHSAEALKQARTEYGASQTLLNEIPVRVLWQFPAHITNWGRTQQRYVKFRDVSRKPLCHSSLAYSASSWTTPGRDALNDVPGRDTRPGGTQSKSSRFDVQRIRYGLRYRKLPGNTALFECFTDERLRNTEVEERDRGRLTRSAELYVPLLGSTRIGPVALRQSRGQRIFPQVARGAGPGRARGPCRPCPDCRYAPGQGTLSRPLPIPMEPGTPAGPLPESEGESTPARAPRPGPRPADTPLLFSVPTPSESPAETRPHRADDDRADAPTKRR